MQAMSIFYRYPITVPMKFGAGFPNLLNKGGIYKGT